ncbi:MAG: Trk system potassium transporter TrkA [Clostridiales bacterium]|nr:Trk system potassium transporter TrkA [Clostridiales bacterium]
MNVIIVGCGRVGRTLAEKLNNDGNDVTVIDMSAEKVEKVINRCDVMGIVGNGATYTVQREAGIDKADLLIAVTNSDELNLLCCIIAQKEGNCQTVARVKNPEYSADASYLKEELNLAMVINPEYEAAEEIARVLRFPSAIKIEPFAKGKVELVKFKLQKDSPAIGLSVKELVTKYRLDALVCTIERGEEAYIASGNFVFAEKDVVSIVATPKNANEFFKKLHSKGHSVKNALVVGGGVIAHYLCEILSRSGIGLKIVEKNKTVCEEIAEEWEDVDVIHGDASDHDLLLEEGVTRADAFVALADLDEENILLSVFAKGVGCGKLVTKINRMDYANVINQLDLDTLVCPRAITADTILRYVRARKNTSGSNVETLHNLIPGKVEASEFLVRETSPIIGVPLYQLKFKKSVLIASITRSKEVILPRGQDVILAGDSVVVISSFPLHDIAEVLK